nr:unnamed protein product [Digitaria exilis]
MADLAIGISKTVVEALVNKVNNAIKEEKELWKIVERDTLFMKDEFEMMQSFLKTADWEQVKNTVGRTWVRQVRELSYDAEDSVDTIVHLDTKRSLWTIWRRFWASCNCNCGAPSELELAVDAIILLKGRVEEVSNRNKRYSFIYDSGSMTAMSQQLACVPAIGTTAAAVDILIEAWSTEQKLGGSVNFSMLINESCDSQRVIALWGTRGDLGVTSIIKEAYEGEVIRQKYRSRAWLKLAYPFNPREFIGSLAEQVYGNSGVEIIDIDVPTNAEQVAKYTDLVKNFVEQIKEHRYLVVLEGLSNMSEWQAVLTYLPDNRNGSLKRTQMRPSHFVRRWIAEGYSKCTNSKTMEDYAAELFNRLTKKTASMGEWRVNSFFHEYINSRLMEERAVFFPLVVSIWDKSRSLIAMEGLGQHLVIRSSWNRNEDFVFEDEDFSHLQSLTVCGTWKPYFIPYTMKSLRVLDLEGTSNIYISDNHDELQRMLLLLPRLRFLSLRGHMEIEHLPDSLYGLRHLQTLDIRRTSVVYIELQKLKKLQYLRAGTALSWMDDRGIAAKEESTASRNSSGFLASWLLNLRLPGILGRGPAGPCNGIKVRGGINQLQDLHTLGAVNINTADGMGILDEICHLRQLKKLELSGVNRENSKFLSKSILNQKNWESLTLQLEKDNHVVCWDDISPPSSIRILKLYGHVEELSARRYFIVIDDVWDESVLRVLDLEVCSGHKIEDICNLVHLRLTQLPEGIGSMPSLEEVSEVDITKYPNLMEGLGKLCKLRVLKMSLDTWDWRHREPLLKCLCNIKQLQAGVPKIGLWGGTRGRLHGINVAPHHLRSVIIRSGLIIDSLAFTYYDHDGQEAHGVVLVAIHLDSGEFLCKISGTIGAFDSLPNAVTSLKFTTNICSQWYVDAIGVYVGPRDQDEAGLAKFRPWGGDGEGVRTSMQHHTVLLGPSEFLTGISGTIDSYEDRSQIQLEPSESVVKLFGTIGTFNGIPNVVTSLTLVTSNAHRYGPYGREEGTAFHIPLQSNGSIVGFFAQADEYIRAIGVYVRTP